MKPYLLQTLKKLALLGGIQNKIELSSRELSDQMDISQQTASRYLLDLDKKDLIIREQGVKKQLIQITKKGKDVLREEHLHYKQIFEFKDRVYFKGKVISGLGEGRYYTEQKGYLTQFKEKLSFVPSPGTLNVEIEYVEKNKLRFLKNCEGITIQEFETSNRTFGGVKCFKAEINRVEGAIVLPLRSHYTNILEFISPYHLRDKLDLKDGDEVDVVIYLEN